MKHLFRNNNSNKITTPDLLWAAFPSHTPYHYAYNSALIWSDPSGLAPEKERDREKLLNIEQFDYSYLNRITDELDKSRQYMSSEMSNADGSPMGENQGLRLGSSGDYKFGYRYWTDGFNFERTYYINNHEGSFNYVEWGKNEYGYEVVSGRTFDINTIAGVDQKAWLVGAQNFLDGYSMLDQGPGGAIASVLSAIIDVYKGDFFSAGMGLLAAVPIAGIIGDAYKAGKLVKNAERTLDSIDELKRFDKNQSALIDLAKERKNIGGVINDEMYILKEWSNELNIPFREPEIHPDRNFNIPHLHIGPVDHIPLKGKKK